MTRKLKKRNNPRKIKTIAGLTEKYKEKIHIKTNGEFSLIGTYNDKVIEIHHKKCNRISELNPRYFMSKLLCPLCERDKRYQQRLEKTKIIVAEFKEELKKIVGDEYEVLEDFMNPDERKVLIRHNKCGKVYRVKINSFMSGRRCPDCTKTQPKSPEKYMKEFESVAKNEFTLLTPYERATKKVKILCHKCNEESSVNPSYFLRDARCPNCEKNHPHKKDE